MCKKPVTSWIKYFGIVAVVIGLIRMITFITISAFFKHLLLEGPGYLSKITNGIYLLTWISFFIFGIGVLRLKIWALKLLLWLAIIAIPTNIIEIIDTLISQGGRFKITWIIGIFIQIFPSILYLIYLKFFNRSEVKDQFGKKLEESIL